MVKSSSFSELVFADEVGSEEAGKNNQCPVGLGVLLSSFLFLGLISFNLINLKFIILKCRGVA